MALDFTALNRIACKGFETVEGQEKKDALIEHGFTVAESAGDPFAQEADSAPPPIQKDETSTASSRYNALYRAAYEFHKRHYPPVVDREYWREHSHGASEAELMYWEATAHDLMDTAAAYKDEPFFMSLLMSVYEELEREYRATRKGIKGEP